MNPINRFKQSRMEKVGSAPLDAAKAAAPSTLSRFSQSIGKGMLSGLGAAAATGMIAGVTLGAQKAYQAMTKSRDFKRMMDPSLNPDLHEEQAKNPAFFNQAFTSLHNMHPEFARDPIVAGAVLRQVTAMPASGGGVLMNVVAPTRNQFPSWARDKMVEHGGQAAHKSITEDVSRIGRREDEGLKSEDQFIKQLFLNNARNSGSAAQIRTNQSAGPEVNTHAMRRHGPPGRGGQRP